MDLGKIPPHDIEAEQAIIGSMLTDKDAVISSIEVLPTDDAFYREDNRIIYSAIVSLYSKNEPIDIITVKAELIEQGNFERIGGLTYLADLPERVPTTTNIEKYIKIVEEKSMLRHLIQSANDLIALGYDETEEVTSVMDLAEKKIFYYLLYKNLLLLIFLLHLQLHLDLLAYFPIWLVLLRYHVVVFFLVPFLFSLNI